MEAVRWPFRMFALQPTSPPASGSVLVATQQTAGGLECSDIAPCAGLIHKAVQLVADVAELAAKPIRIQGTLFAEGTRNPDAEWIDLTGNIAVNGIFVISLVTNTVGATQIPLEPELTYLRIISTLSGGQAPLPLGLPITLKARLSGVWLGEGKWRDRISARNIHPSLNSDTGV